VAVSAPDFCSALLYSRKMVVLMCVAAIVSILHVLQEEHQFPPS
jgi:hypothetical protein